MRRAFTVLEIVLAVAIGSIVVATSLGMLASIDRTDRRLEIRHQQRMELTRARTAIQRAMTSLVVEQTVDLNEQDPPPLRMDLRPLDSSGAQRLFGIARATGVDLGVPQSFELVVGNAPEPAGSLLALRIAPDVVETPAPGEDDASLEAGEQPTHRGVFELWPDGARPRSPEAEGAWFTCEGMTLWWIPLAEPGGAPVSTSPAGGAVPLASGLVACQWRVFRDSKRQTEYSATSIADLPGYVEFEASTNAGIHVNWMFEIMWTVGAEGEVSPDGDDRGGGGGSRGGSADGAGADGAGAAPPPGGSGGGGGRSGR